MSKIGAYWEILRPLNSIMLGISIIVGALITGSTSIMDNTFEIANAFISGFCLTGASMTIISFELAQKTGHEDLNEVARRTFSTVKGLISCPIVQREVIVGDIYKKQNVAVNLEDDSNLLGVDFFESREYIIDNPSKCIYIWNK